MQAALQTFDDQEQFHDEIMKYFDLAEDIIEAVEENQHVQGDLQITLIEPVIHAVQEAAEDLSDAYLDYVESDRKVGRKLSKRIENSVRKIFQALQQFTAEVEKIPSEIAQSGNAKVIRMRSYKEGLILKKLVAQVNAAKNHQVIQALQNEQERLPDFALVIGAVKDLGLHNLLVGRALEVIGLVSGIDKIEPGATASKRLVSQRSGFTDMLKQAQELSEQQKGRG